MTPLPDEASYFVNNLTDFLMVGIALCAAMYVQVRLYLAQQRRVEEQNAVLAQANRAKTQFLANTSPEMLPHVFERGVTKGGTGNVASGHGLYTDGKVTVRGNTGKLTLTGGSAYHTYGIEAADVTIEGDDVTAVSPVSTSISGYSEPVTHGPDGRPTLTGGTLTMRSYSTKTSHFNRIGRDNLTVAGGYCADASYDTDGTVGVTTIPWEGLKTYLDVYGYVKFYHGTAPTTVYPVWVRGVQVTDANKADVLGDGKVSYNSRAKTLTLNGANITAVNTAARPHRSPLPR